MLHILLHDYHFDEDWAADTLRPLLREDTKVVIMPLSSDDGWANESVWFHDQYRSQGASSRELMHPFLRYGIPKGNITVLNHYEEDFETLRTKLQKADVLFLYGDNVNASLNCVNDSGLSAILSDYDGILFSVGPAASILGELAGVYEEEDYYEIEGLGILSGIDLDMEYVEDGAHLQRMIRMLEMRGRQVLVCPAKGCILLDDGECALLGEAFIASENDLDELYDLYRARY